MHSSRWLVPPTTTARTSMHVLKVVGKGKGRMLPVATEPRSIQSQTRMRTWKAYAATRTSQAQHRSSTSRDLPQGFVSPNLRYLNSSPRDDDFAGEHSGSASRFAPANAYDDNDENHYDGAGDDYGFESHLDLELEAIQKLVDDTLVDEAPQQRDMPDPILLLLDLILGNARTRPPHTPPVSSPYSSSSSSSHGALSPTPLDEILTVSRGVNELERLNTLRVALDNELPIATAEDILTAMRRSGVASPSSLVEGYNLVMRKHIEAHNHARARTLFGTVREEFTPNFESYVLMVLSCAHELTHNLTRAPGEREPRHTLRGILRSMLRQKHNLRQVHQRVKMSDADVVMFDNAVRTVWPDFTSYECTPASPPPAPGDTTADHTGLQWDREADVYVHLKSLPTRSTFSKRKRKPKAIKRQGELQKESVLYCLHPCVTKALTDLQISKTRKHALASIGFRKHALSPTHFMFSLLSASELAKITLSTMEDELIGIGEGNGSPNYRLCSQVGNNVFRKHFVKAASQTGLHAEQMKIVYNEYCDVLSNPDTNTGIVHRELWDTLLEKHNVVGASELQPSWTPRAMTAIGEVLVRTVLENTTATMLGQEENVAAFYQSYAFSQGKVTSFIKAIGVLANARARSSRNTQPYLAGLLPMLTPPRPWTDGTTPLLVTPSVMVRCSDDSYGHHSLLVRANGQLSTVCDALNIVGSCPWKINKFIFEQVKPLYESEESYPDLTVPPLHIEFEDQLPREEIMQLDPDARREYDQRYGLWRKLKNENISLRADFSNKVNIANAYLDQEQFYLPHNLDFRGRTYSIAPYLNHFMGDMSRALMIFGDGKPLGERGLYWLKVQLANLYGIDKVSFDARVQFVDDNIDNVFQSVLDPMGKNKGDSSPQWWRLSENPWQTLAACAELKAAIDSGDPQNFVSTLPVHQDGTCNGLQHYAALGGDPEGAAAVNLCNNIDGDRPADVYMRVCDRVNSILKLHAQGDFSTFDPNEKISIFSHEHAQEMAQQLLDHRGDIARKTIKQTVMTSVYGVTFHGAREQIMKQLVPKYDLERPFLWKASAYLASVTLASLDDLFQQANTIKLWLSDAAHQIALSGKPVQWTTPLNFPVIQPYHKKPKTYMQGSQDSIMVLESARKKLEPIPSKHKAAFPPNFVHSLDSSHLMKTAIACNENGVRFVAIHDSYWTHAATVDDLSKHTREQFVDLYSEPVLEHLCEYFRLYHNGDERSPRNDLDNTYVVDIPPPPAKGSFNLDEVLTSKYFFN
eukprot:m.139507 g.139507  ORF g.139507 m.139507 type:complete len:1261 (-) comp30063_c0_seq1:315-4097(-)